MNKNDVANYVKTSHSVMAKAAAALAQRDAEVTKYAQAAKLAQAQITPTIDALFDAGYAEATPTNRAKLAQALSSHDGTLALLRQMTVVAPAAPNQTAKQASIGTPAQKVASASRQSHTPTTSGAGLDVLAARMGISPA